MKKITKDINLPAIGLSYFALFSLSLIENAKSPIYPNLLNEFNLTHKDGSWVFTLASLFGIFATISSNFWLKKFGVFKAKKYLATALVIGTILSSISLNVFKSYSIFLIGCAIVGLAMGGLSITMNLLIDSSVPSKWRRQAFSGLHSLYGMASFCSPAVLILIVNQGFKWQQVFNFLIVFPVLLLIFTRNKKFLPKIKMIKKSSRDLISSVSFVLIHEFSHHIDSSDFPNAYKGLKDCYAKNHGMKLNISQGQKCFKDNGPCLEAFKRQKESVNLFCRMKKENCLSVYFLAPFSRASLRDISNFSAVICDHCSVDS